MTLTVTFNLGTDPDKAQQLVQNRVSQAEPRLPEEVRQLGITTIKSSPDLTMVVHLLSPNNRYDMTYLRNYAMLNVKDRLARIDGVGDVQLFGSGDYSMRVWLDPQKVAEHGLTASDVVKAIRAQNVQVAAGVVGASPSVNGLDLQLSVNARRPPLERGAVRRHRRQDRRATARSRGCATSRASSSAPPNTACARCSTTSRRWRSRSSRRRARTRSQISDNVRATMDELKKNMPEGVDYQIVYDPTQFVRSSIEAVIHTLLEAIALVVLVVILFLQTWRASIIPLLAVPVSIVGTFAVMHLLRLFDQRAQPVRAGAGHRHRGRRRHRRGRERRAQHRVRAVAARRHLPGDAEVSGPIIAIALVLIAVFVPLAFISGLTGQFYKQFALTIAISTVISAFNSLTLSPALAALLLKGHDEPKDWLTRVMDTAFGWFFRGFNRVFARASDNYSGSVTQGDLRQGDRDRALCRAGRRHGRAVQAGAERLRAGAGQAISGRLRAAARWRVARSHRGGHPPDERHRAEAAGRRERGRVSGPVDQRLHQQLERRHRVLDAEAVRRAQAIRRSRGSAIAADLNKKFAGIQDAFIAMFPPPPVNGLGTIGGFKLQIEDRAGLGYEALNDATKAFMARAVEGAGARRRCSPAIQVNVPQLFADIDRTKAQQLGVPVTDVFNTMQIYLGSFYVNDFNNFGRTYSVHVQADAPFRARADDIGQLKVRSAAGDMVPLSALLKVTPERGPGTRDALQRLPVGRHQRRRRLRAIRPARRRRPPTRIAAETLPPGIAFEWTDLTYQEFIAGNSGTLGVPAGDPAGVPGAGRALRKPDAAARRSS